MEEFSIVEKCPDVDSYNQLRKIVGWRSINGKMAEIGLAKRPNYGCEYRHGMNLLLNKNR